MKRAERPGCAPIPPGSAEPVRGGPAPERPGRAVEFLRVGWAAAGRDGQADTRRVFQAMAGCLEPGQTLGVLLERPSAGAAVTVGIEFGVARGGRAAARALAERVRATLDAFGPLVGLEPAPNRPTWKGLVRHRIRPARVVIGISARTGPGFSRTPEVAEAAVSVPILSNRPRVADDLLEAIHRAGGSRIRAVLRVKRCRIDRADSEMLARAIGSLQEGDRIWWNGVPWTPGPTGAKALDALVALLEAWTRSGGEGWRLGCTVESDQPLPPGVLDLACAVVFGGGRARSAPDPADSSLDLSDHLPLDVDVPVLLPGPVPLIRAGVTRTYSAEAVPGEEEGVLVGEARTAGAVRPVRIPTPDRSRHVYVVGATGTGKSTLLYNMIVQDMRAGRGVGLIDPHGDLFRRVLEAVPPRRAADVVLMDFTDFGFVPGVNLLEVRGRRPELQRGFAVNEMIRIFDRLYDLRQTGGPIFEQYMRNALLLALNARGHRATLLDACRIFECSAYRSRLLGRCTDPQVVHFWRGQAEVAFGEASLANLTPYITSKVNQFVQNPLIRCIVGQERSTVDIARIMEEGRILLVNLAKGLLGDLDAQLLGMILMGKIFQAGLSRAALPEHRRTPFHLFVDEFQNFCTETVSHMLSEARKFGLHLVLANQSLQQIARYHAPGQAAPEGGGVLGAVLANAGTLVVFRTSPMDAPHLQPFVGRELSAQDLQELPDFHAVVRLLVRGSPFRPFVLRTYPPMEDRGKVRCARAVRRVARERYARPRAEVEAELHARLLWDDD